MTPADYNELAKIHGWRVMEDWEVALRTKLEDELEEGMYNISSPGLTLWTGKGGKIECEVAFHREMLKWLAVPTPDILRTDKASYTKVTYNKFRELIKDVLFSKKN